MILPLPFDFLILFSLDSWVVHVLKERELEGNTVDRSTDQVKGKENKVGMPEPYQSLPMHPFKDSSVMALGRTYSNRSNILPTDLSNVSWGQSLCMSPKAIIFHFSLFAISLSMTTFTLQELF